LPSPIRATPPREARRRLKALVSPEVFPFAVLLLLSLISLASRVWLMARPLLASYVGI